ncbi:Secreted protein OS=Streptomyces alboniger OX=132473 GN=CP975_12595 PE=4 SV=1 [Streptomyces alboniger]
MRRGLVHTVAWSLATGAAVTLSWWGVHTVMAGTAYDPPRALPLADGGGTEPLSSSTHRAGPAPSKKPPRTGGGDDEAGKSGKAGKPEKTAEAPAPSRPRPHTPTAPPPAGPAEDTGGGTGTVRSYRTDGGRVVFDLGKESATLVSATPAPGWSVQTWKQEKWIRVEFTGGAAKVSVFCTWHDTAPRVEINTY